MQRLDDQYLMRTPAAPQLKRLPSEYMNTNCWYTSQPMESTNLKALECTFEMIKAETQLLWASDWPHFDFDIPSVMARLPFLSEQGKKNVLGLNAARLFNLPIIYRNADAGTGGGGTGDAGAGAGGGAVGGAGAEGGGGGGSNQPTSWYAPYNLDEASRNFIADRKFDGEGGLQQLLKSSIESDRMARSRNVFERPDPAKPRTDWQHWEQLGWKPRTSFAELVRMMVDADLDLLSGRLRPLA